VKWGQHGPLKRGVTTQKTSLKHERSDHSLRNYIEAFAWRNWQKPRKFCVQ